MSVPHLDTRIIGGQRSLLFGPYAGFSTKFQKHGSLLDLLESVRPGNIGPMLSVARDNLDLTEYLFEQVLQSESHRLAALDEYYPRRTRATGSFRSLGSGCKSSSPTSGAEDCWSSEPSWSALRIARLSRFSAPRPALRRPPRSRSACLEKYFPDELTQSAWLPKLREMIPSYGVSLIDDANLTRRIRAETAAVLKLENV